MIAAPLAIEVNDEEHYAEHVEKRNLIGSCSLDLTPLVGPGLSSRRGEQHMVRLPLDPEGELFVHVTLVGWRVPSWMQAA